MNKTHLLAAAVAVVVLLAAIGLIDGETLKTWLPAIWGQVETVE